MSYFNVDTIKEMTDEGVKDIALGEIPIEPTKKRNHQGQLNPHYGCVMTQESKDKISQTQKKRYEMINRLILLGKNQMTEEKVRDIVLQLVISEDKVREMINDSIVTKEEIAEICRKALAENLDRIEAETNNTNKPIEINYEQELQ